MPKLLRTAQKLSAARQRNPVNPFDAPCLPMLSHVIPSVMIRFISWVRSESAEGQAARFHTSPVDSPAGRLGGTQRERRAGQDDPFPWHPPEQAGRQGPGICSCSVPHCAEDPGRGQWQRHATRAPPIAPASVHRGLAGGRVRCAGGAFESARFIQPGARRSCRLAVCRRFPGRSRQRGPHRAA